MKHGKHHFSEHYLYRKQHSARMGEEEMFLRFRHGGGRDAYGRRGEGKRFFERGQFKFALLELLAEEAMHGYQIIKAMEEKTGGLYVPSAGSVYPNLQLLEDMGYISSSDAEGKKLYKITPAGQAHLAERAQQIEARGGYRGEDERWQHRRGFHHGDERGRHPKHQLRSFMKDWSELVYLMAQAAQAAQQAPDSEQAKQFQELMKTTEASLQQMMKPLTDSSPQEKEDPEEQQQ